MTKYLLLTLFFTLVFLYGNAQTKKFEPEKNMVKINTSKSKKIRLKVGQKAYYQGEEHWSVGLMLSADIDNKEIIEKKNSHYTFQDEQIEGTTGGDKGTRTFIFEAKKEGKTIIDIKYNFRGDIEKRYKIKVIVEAE